MSINVGPLREGKHKCEMNNATAENPFEFQLVNGDRFTYVAIEVSLHVPLALPIIQLVNAFRSISRHMLLTCDILSSRQWVLKRRLTIIKRYTLVKQGGD